MELLDICRSERIAVVYDVGAFIGTWSLLARARLPRAEIHAFEPLPEHGRRFRQLTAHCPGVTLHEVAMGAHPGRADMHVAERSDSSSLLPLTSLMLQEFDIREREERSVSVVRLDDYISSEGLPAPDLIKLDVQGGELDVLRGGVQCLSRARWILSEVSFKRFYAGQPLFGDVVGFLLDYGFEVCALGADTPVATRLSQTDVLFRRTS